MKGNSFLFTLLVVAFLGLAGYSVVQPVAAAPSGQLFDSSCGQTYTAFDPNDHSIPITQANGLVSCWISGTVQMWEIRQPEMVGDDTSKPAYGLFFPIPEAEICYWWGHQARLIGHTGHEYAPRYAPEEFGVFPIERIGATVDDPTGGSGAGFALVCENIVSDRPIDQPTEESTPGGTIPSTPTPAPFARVCTTPMVAFAGDPDAGGVQLPAAPLYQPQIDTIWEGEKPTGLIIGQWNIAGQPPAAHWYCVNLPAGEWKVENGSGSIQDQFGHMLVDGSGSFTLTQTSVIWILTQDGAQLRGPAWQIDLPFVAN